MQTETKLKLKYSFRLKEDEAISFQKKLTETGLRNESEFIRHCLKDKEFIIKDESLERAKIKLFSKVSNNLNQAVKALHIDRKKEEISEETYDKLLEELNQIKQISLIILGKK